MTVTGIAALIITVITIVLLVRIIREIVVGIKCVHWLHGEWLKMVDQGMVGDETYLQHALGSVRFFVRTFGSFQSTRFTSKFGNRFENGEIF
jgi:hypothetical protein